MDMSGEMLVKELLRRKWPNEKVLYNYRPEWLINQKTGRALELDIYYPDLNYAVEVQGPHHLLIEQRTRDEIKFKVCRERGIQLDTIALKTKSLKKFCTRLQIPCKDLRHHIQRFGRGTPKKGSPMWKYHKHVEAEKERDHWRKIYTAQRLESEGNRRRALLKLQSVQGPAI